MTAKLSDCGQKHLVLLAAVILSFAGIIVTLGLAFASTQRATASALEQRTTHTAEILENKVETNAEKLDARIRSLEAIANSNLARISAVQTDVTYIRQQLDKKP